MQKETHLVCYQITVSSVALIGLKTMAVHHQLFSSFTYPFKARTTRHSGALPPSMAPSARETLNFLGPSRQTPQK